MSYFEHSNGGRTLTKSEGEPKVLEAINRKAARARDGEQGRRPERERESERMMAATALSDVTQQQIGAKRSRKGATRTSSSSSIAADDELPPPAKRMATAAGQATHQSSATAPASAAPAASGLSRFGFGFKAPASFTKTAATVDAGVATGVLENDTAAGSNQSEHEAPRGDVEIKVESAATTVEVRDTASHRVCLLALCFFAKVLMWLTRCEQSDCGDAGHERTRAVYDG